MRLRGRADQKQISSAKLSIELVRQDPHVHRTTRQSKVYNDCRSFRCTGNDDFRLKDCASRVIRQTKVKNIGFYLFGFRNEQGFSDRKAERLRMDINCSESQTFE